MSPIIPEKLPDCINDSVKNVANPITTNIGKTIGDLWFLALGGISQYAEKKRIKYAIELEQLKKLLEEKVEAIPPERKVEPNTQIVCQALEDAKYCAENVDIREMFANLIAATMDSKTCDQVHPSFSAILKQMTSNDAIFFQKFSEKQEIPVCNFLLKSYDKDKGYIQLLKNAYIENENIGLDEACSVAFVISSLERLGLIQVTYRSFINSENPYWICENSDTFRELQNENDDNSYFLAIEKGVAYSTELGNCLLEICCPNNTVDD